MKILHVVGKMHRGGIETLVMEIFRRIDRSKIEFHFLVFSKEEGDYDREIIKLGGKIQYVVSRRENPIENYKQIDNLIKKEKYDCIHDHLSSLSYIAPLIIGNKNKVKMLVAHSHNTSQGHGIVGNILHNVNKSRIGKCCTHLMACSSDAGYWMFGKKLWENKGRVVRNGINVNLFLYNSEIREQMRHKMGIEDGTIVVGFSGRFEEQKNPLFVIKIFRDLKKYIPNARLLMLGNGSLKCKMINCVNEYGLSETISFLGVVNNVSEYLQAMDIFLFPSLFEGLGISLIEAQCADLPVFTSTRVPSEAKVLDSFYQIELKKDSEQWAQEIFKFISKNTLARKNVRLEMMRKGYSIDVVAKEVEQFYLGE